MSYYIKISPRDAGLAVGGVCLTVPLAREVCASAHFLLKFNKNQTL